MEKDFWKVKILFIMEALLIGWSMVKGKRDFCKEILIKESIKMEDLMGLESINGEIQMQFMKEVLKMDLDMVKVNGVKIKANMWVILFKVWNKDTVNFISQVETFTKEISLGIKDRDMDKCFGVMDLFIKVNGKMVSKTVKDKYT
jgi:hypothetical protein